MGWVTRQHLGRFTMTADFQIDVLRDPEECVGWFRLIAANENGALRHEHRTRALLLEASPISRRLTQLRVGRAGLQTPRGPSSRVGCSSRPRACSSVRSTAPSISTAEAPSVNCLDLIRRFQMPPRQPTISRACSNSLRALRRRRAQSTVKMLRAIWRTPPAPASEPPGFT